MVLRQPGQVVDRVYLLLGAAQVGQGSERAGRGGGISQQIEEHAADTVEVVGLARSAGYRKTDRQANQHVTGLGNRRIGQQAAHIVLPQGQQISQRHGHHGQGQRQLPAQRLQAGHGHISNTNQGHEARDLGNDRQQTGVGIGGALVHVGSIKMERHHGDAKAQAGHDEDQSQPSKPGQRGALGAGRSQSLLDLIETGRSCRTVEERESVEQQGRGQDAQKEILGACLEQLRPTSEEQDDVRGDRDQLETDEDRHQVSSQRHEHHAGQERQERAHEFRRFAFFRRASREHDENQTRPQNAPAQRGREQIDGQRTAEQPAFEGRATDGTRALLIEGHGRQHDASRRNPTPTATQRQERTAQINERGEQHQDNLGQQQIRGFSRHGSALRQASSRGRPSWEQSCADRAGPGPIGRPGARVSVACVR